MPTLPRVILHNTVSVDGRRDWFSPDVGLFYELASHWKEDATLAGADTLLASGAETDDAALDSAEPPAGIIEDGRPLLVVPDSRGRIRMWRSLLDSSYWRGGIALCSRTTEERHRDYLARIGVDCIVSGDDHADLHFALELLAVRYGVKTVRVDSGGTLNGVLLRAGLVDEVSILIEPCLVGGLTPRSMFKAEDLASEDALIRLRLSAVEQPREHCFGCGTRYRSKTSLLRLGHWI